MVVAAACALGASLILAHFVRRRLVERFTRALDDMRRVLDGANAGLSRERARLETLVECIPDALVIANLRGEVLFCNAAALPLFSASREDMMSGGKGLLQPRDPSRWRMRVQEVLKAHTSCGVMEMPYRCGWPADEFSHDGFDARRPGDGRFWRVDSPARPDLGESHRERPVSAPARGCAAGLGSTPDGAPLSTYGR